MIHDVIVVGGGISGLALARELQAHGLAALVLERARGVGGRCATRRIDGQPVDHGVAYLHGRAPRFLAELDAVRDAVAIPDWPRVRKGSGVPCQPEAFDGWDRRIAFVEGVSRLAKHLARDVPVRLETNVTALRAAVDHALPARQGWELTLTSGESLRASTVALAIPAPSALTLLRKMAPPPAAIAALLPLLEMVRMLPCLTVIARYPIGVPAPSWDAGFPDSSVMLHTLLHDSSKRAEGARLMLVVQARPAFSRAHLDDPVDSWARVLLAEAAVLHGAWIAQPECVQSHIWRNARVAAGTELARPPVVRLDDGTLLGIAGDGFHEAGGVEGAYLSGIALAERLREMQPGRT